MSNKVLCSGICLILLLSCIVGAGYAANAEEDEMIQANVDNYMTIEPNYNADKVTYSRYSFKDEPLAQNIFYYRAFKFKTPPWEGKLIWSFLNIVEELKSVIGWQILPAQGTMTGFIGMDFKKLKVDLPGISSKGPDALLQEIPAERLQPDQYYIIKFLCKDNKPFDLAISLNIMEDTELTYRDLFADLVNF